MDTSGSAPRDNWNEHVQIREVGAGGQAVVPLPEDDDAATNPASSGSISNKPFRAAWLLTALLLAVGLLWIGGAFEAATMASYSSTLNPATGEQIGPDLPPLTTQLRNLGQSAPMLLVVGLMSASALLIVQGAQRTRVARAANH